MISVIVKVIDEMKIHHSCNKVVLSGGTFQNRYLLEGTEKMLTGEGFEVYSHHLVPTNDGGISLGQLAVAAKRRQMAKWRNY
jgi:hydrogenase maturation protein HypF